VNDTIPTWVNEITCGYNHSYGHDGHGYGNYGDCFGQDYRYGEGFGYGKEENDE